MLLSIDHYSICDVIIFSFSTLFVICKIYDKFKEVVRQILELHFCNTPEKLRGGYLDMYEGIQSEVIGTTGFNEYSNLSMTHLGRTDLTRASKMKAEENFLYKNKGIL